MTQPTLFYIHLIVGPSLITISWFLAILFLRDGFRSLAAVFTLLALGVMLNWAVVIANNGKMPVATENFFDIVSLQSGDEPYYVLADKETKLTFLADRIPRNYYFSRGKGSIGDIPIELALVILIFFCAPYYLLDHIRTVNKRRRNALTQQQTPE